MPADIALLLLRKTQMETQVSKDALTIACLWAIVGLVLSALMFRFGFAAEIAEALMTAG